MRILYHHRSLADGAEGIHIAAMVDAFRQLGHEVRVLGAASAPGAQASRAAAVKAWLPGVAFEVASIAYNLVERRAMARAIAEWRPDLIYKRHARFDVGALSAARRARVPSVLEVNAVYSARPYRDFEPQVLQSLSARLERQAFRAATTVIAVSSPMGAQVQALAGRSAVVVPNGADPTLFDPATTPARGAWSTKGGLVLGWSGGLRAWHGLELLLEALTHLPEHTQLLVVGDGPARAALQQRASALGVAARLHVTGQVTRAAMPASLAAMDVGVVPDERTGVASPMKLLEYMAMGRAVVAPDLPNIRDVVTHGETGLLFEAGKVAALVQALSRLAADPALRSRLGRSARREIVERRHWTAIASHVIDIAARS